MTVMTKEELKDEKNKLDLERRRLELTKLKHETEQAAKDAEKARLEVEVKRLVAAQNDRNELDRKASEARTGFFDFIWEVHEPSVLKFVDWLDFFMVRYPKKPITVRIGSPGGSIFNGFQMMDSLREARNAGHEVTVKVSGMAASMAGVIAQCADKRLIGEESYLMLHTAKVFQIGSYSTFELTDQAELMKRLTRDCLDAYTRRSEKWTTDALYERIERQEWWVDAQEAVAEGFMDGTF